MTGFLAFEADLSDQARFERSDFARRVAFVTLSSFDQCKCSHTMMLLLEVVFDFRCNEEHHVADYVEPPCQHVDQRSITSPVSLRISSSRGRVLRMEADALRGVRLGTWVICLSLECSVDCIVELLPGNCSETFLFQGADYLLLHLFSLFLRRT